MLTRTTAAIKWLRARSEKDAGIRIEAGSWISGEVNVNMGITCSKAIHSCLIDSGEMISLWNMTVLALLVISPH